MSTQRWAVRAAEVFARAPQIEGEHSITEALAAIERGQVPRHDALGRLLLLPRTGVVVVPHARAPGPAGGYYATVVVGNDVYPRGGYGIAVSDNEISTAVEIALEVACAVTVP